MAGPSTVTASVFLIISEYCNYEYTWSFGSVRAYPTKEARDAAFAVIEATKPDTTSESRIRKVDLNRDGVPYLNTADDCAMPHFGSGTLEIVRD